jgi:RimJ/RimL family protein N-acetyltransferase
MGERVGFGGASSVKRGSRGDDPDLVSRAISCTRAAARGEAVDPLQVELRDGTRLQLRPIRTEDKERLRRGLEWLSPRTRQLGFHTQLQAVTDAQLRYVTEIDHHDHVAWLAVDPEAPEVPAVALARYIRLDGAPDVAEAAITVVDAYQDRGLGTVLLGLLAGVAVSNGIRAFRNYVLAENEPVLAVFEQLGAARQLLTPEVYEIDLSLPLDPATLPDTPVGRALRAVARDVRPGSHLALSVPPVWLRGRRTAPTPSRTPVAPAVLRERGPFGDWLDAAFDAEEQDPGEPSQE